MWCTYNPSVLLSGRVEELEGRLRGEGGEESADRLVDLEISLAEREEEKGNLQLRILELEETISAEVFSYP